MDGAGASDLYRAVTASWIAGYFLVVRAAHGRLRERQSVAVLRSHDPGKEAVASRRVAVVSVEASDVSLGGAATGADLGGSSKYSSENLEGRGGEGFHGNSSWPWVRRS
ncbi:unnamed protein product [Schistocephalus solidus]|uniref:Uncharacterized protein n=1 Tax=Schistocephalus solidus TaxID=70667 RepID=A0A183SCV3_SCHSO|nr:unnamed protein product [Schistocephalus solidus]